MRVPLSGLLDGQGLLHLKLLFARNADFGYNLDGIRFLVDTLSAFRFFQLLSNIATPSALFRIGRSAVRAAHTTPPATVTTAPTHITNPFDQMLAGSLIGHRQMIPRQIQLKNRLNDESTISKMTNESTGKSDWQIMKRERNKDGRRANVTESTRVFLFCPTSQLVDLINRQTCPAVEEEKKNNHTRQQSV